MELLSDIKEDFHAVAMRRAFKVSVPLQIGIEFLALVPLSVIVLYFLKTDQWLMVALSGIIGYYLAKLTIIFLSALAIRCFHPPIGMLNRDDELTKYYINSTLSKFVRRSIASEFYYIMPFPCVWFVKLCGGRIHPTCHIASSNSLSDPHLIDIDEGVLVGEQALIAGHYRPRENESYLIGPVKIGKHVMIGRNASVWPNVIIGDYAVVQENANVYPNTIIGHYEVWGGSPAQKLWSLNQGDHKIRSSESIIDPGKIVVKIVRNFINDYQKFELFGPSFDLNLSFLGSGLLDSFGVLSLLSELENKLEVRLNRDWVILGTITTQQLIDQISKLKVPKGLKSEEEIII